MGLGIGEPGEELALVDGRRELRVRPRGDAHGVVVGPDGPRLGPREHPHGGAGLGAQRHAPDLQDLGGVVYPYTSST